MAAAGLGAAAGGAVAGPLDRVMGAMEADFQVLTRSLFREDYEKARQAARDLENHPTPGLAEKLKLLGRIGTDVHRFQKYDSRVQEAARDIAEAAEVRALDGMVEGYHRLVDSCMACHRRFGDEIVPEKGEE